MVTPTRATQDHYRGKQQWFSSVYWPVICAVAFHNPEEFCHKTQVWLRHFVEVNLENLRSLFPNGGRIHRTLSFAIFAKPFDAGTELTDGSSNIAHARTHAHIITYL